jgi:hypothetical protein
MVLSLAAAGDTGSKFVGGHVGRVAVDVEGIAWKPMAPRLTIRYETDDAEGVQAIHDWFAAQRTGCRGDLGQHVDAVPVLFDHAGETAHLSLSSADADDHAARCG